MVETAMLVGQIVIAIVIAIYISRVAKREIDKKLSQMEEKEAADGRKVEEVKVKPHVASKLV